MQCAPTDILVAFDLIVGVLTRECGRTGRLARVLCGALLLSACAVPKVEGREALIDRMLADARTAPKLAADPAFAAAIAAEARLPREAFVPPAARPYVYLGTPLEIGWEQTISDSWIVAVMTAAARVGPGSHVLEIGTGSGYQAAVLAEMGVHVSTIETVPKLAARARMLLRRRGYRSVTVRAGDGSRGWPQRAPFDAVIVTAGAARVPDALLAQIRVGGRLVMPIGPSAPTEQLEVYTKQADGGVDVCRLGHTMFVPLTGDGRTAERPGLSDHTSRWCYDAPVT